MNMETKAAQTVGCWDQKGSDVETVLIGPITATIIDADRRVRDEWNNGFPNWAMYRAAYCGDSLYRNQVREWCVAYAVAHCEAGGVRAGLPAEQVGCLAGWDAYYSLLNHRWLIAGQDVADIAGVDPKTYRKVRNHVTKALHGSLSEYWMLLQIHYLRALMDARWIEPSEPRTRFNSGRGFGHEVTFPGDGCYIVKAAPFSDTL